MTKKVDEDSENWWDCIDPALDLLDVSFTYTILGEKRTEEFFKLDYIAGGRDMTLLDPGKPPINTTHDEVRRIEVLHMGNNKNIIWSELEKNGVNEDSDFNTIFKGLGKLIEEGLIDKDGNVTNPL